MKKVIVIGAGPAGMMAAIETCKRFGIEGIVVIGGDALIIATKVFNYTNHTIMQEALEKWDVTVVRKISPEIMRIIKKINDTFLGELKALSVDEEKFQQLLPLHQSHTAVGGATINRNIICHQSTSTERIAALYGLGSSTHK